MPYVDQYARDRFQHALGALEQAIAHRCTPGDLNYLFTKLALSYVRAKGLSYTHVNDALGAFTGASAEFYRRLAAPYEDAKRTENGDVYGPE